MTNMDFIKPASLDSHFSDFSSDIISPFYDIVIMGAVDQKTVVYNYLLILGISIQSTMVVITTEGDRQEYNLPKSEIAGYDGAEVSLKINFGELGKYKV
jgi:hypothetical protein